MKYFSMFTGVGGFELGIQRAYDNQLQSTQSNKTDSEGRRKWTTNEQRESVLSSDDSPPCVGVCEIDKYASQLLEQKFKGVKNYGNAREIRTEELPDFDLLVGGFPCQAFSIAGKRRGFEDTRGTLFYEIARIVKAKQPRLLLLENVKGLLNHDKGNTFTQILSTLDELGYDVEWQVLNSKHFGVPQNRERVFIKGCLRGTGGRQIFPIFEDDNPLVTKGGEQALNAVISRTLTATDHKMHLDGNYVKQPFIVAMRGRNPENSSDRTVGAPTEQRLEPNSEGTSNCLSTVQKDNLVTNGARIRRLTPTECERLQGFPDGWTEGFSDTQRYKMMGNAVTVNVIEVIMNKLLEDNS